MSDSLTDIELLSRVKCDKCDGVGVVLHPAWDDYLSRPDPVAMSDAEIMDWFSSRGYLIPHVITSIVTPPIAHMEALVLPPEEIDCPKCKGKGWAEMWVTISICQGISTQAVEERAKKILEDRRRPHGRRK